MNQTMVDKSVRGGGYPLYAFLTSEVLMAANEERGYFTPFGVSQTQIGFALIDYLMNTKKLNVAYEEDEDGFLIVADNKKVAGIQKLAGATAQVSALINADDTGYVKVVVGKGGLGGKAAAAFIGAAINPLLIAPAAYGASKQRTIEREIFDFLESYIQSAQPDPTMSVRETESALLEDIEDYEITSEGGMSEICFCPSCGAQLMKDAKFCSSCGSKTAVDKACPQCYTELLDGQRFCHECGFDTQASA